ncbi:MAG: hypothetical protein ABIN68_02370, partial [Sphingomicrobium sp.]
MQAVFNFKFNNIEAPADQRVLWCVCGSEVSVGRLRDWWSSQHPEGAGSGEDRSDSARITGLNSIDW